MNVMKFKNINLVAKHSHNKSSYWRVGCPSYSWTAISLALWLLSFILAFSRIYSSCKRRKAPDGNLSSSRRNAIFVYQVKSLLILYECNDKSNQAWSKFRSTIKCYEQNNFRIEDLIDYSSIHCDSYSLYMHVNDSCPSSDPSLQNLPCSR